MKNKLYSIGIDVQDLANYALSLLGKDNGVDAYTLIARLEVFDRARSMLGNADIDIPELNCRARDIYTESELVRAGHGIAQWLFIKTNTSIDDLSGCNPSDY